MKNQWLHRFAVLVAVCTLLLIAAGASVTSNDAGLSVPDWPLSYGKVMPEMKGGVLYEHGHRMIASAVGFLVVILAIWLWRAEDRSWVKKLGFAALGLVILQGVFGGLTVLLMLPKWTSIVHACLAQLFFCTTVAIAIFTSPLWRQGPQFVQDYGWPSIRSLSTITPILVLTQTLLGAVFRHKAAGLMPHVIGAMLVTGVILLLCVFILTQFPKHETLRKYAIALMTALLGQIFLGIAAYMTRLSQVDLIQPGASVIVFTILHVAVGALVMGLSVALAIQVRRHVLPKTAMSTQQHSPVTS